MRTYDLIDDAFNALEAGQVEAVINDFPVSKYAERAKKDLVVVQAIQTDEEYGFAFAKGSDELRNAVNERARRDQEGRRPTRGSTASGSSGSARAASATTAARPAPRRRDASTSAKGRLTAPLLVLSVER